jgi:fructoselysine 6-kinase
MKLLAMTCCCVDVFVNSGALLPGGNVLNVCADWAIQKAQILKDQPVQANACDIAILGAVGGDVYGQAIRDTLAPLAIDTSHLHTIDDITANHRICIDPSGERYFEPEAWTGGAYESFRLSVEDELFIQKADTVAITFNDPNLPRVLALRRQSPFRLAVDFQDAWEPDEWTPWLDAIDVFFISGTPENEPMLAVWSGQHPDKDFIATRGASGSVLYRNGVAHVQEAVAVPMVADTTGCGDAWLAGYLMATQAGAELREAMQAGAEAAAVVIGHVGGFKLP